MTVFQPLLEAAKVVASRLDKASPATSAPALQITHALSLDTEVDLAAWLAAQNGDEKIYWRARDGAAELAVLDWGPRWQGDAARQQLRQPSDSLRFWLSGFDPQLAWQGWPDALLVQPVLAILRQQQQWQLLVQCPPERAASVAASLRGWHQRVHRSGPLPAVIRQDQPAAPEWAADVDAVRQAIDRGELAKVVLARRTRLEAGGAISLWSLFQHWREQGQRCYQLALQQGQRGFLSFSPERLYRRAGDQLQSEALAGTFWNSDASLSVGCSVGCIDAKLSHEHALVVEDLQRKLSRCCDLLRGDDAVGLYPQPNMQHLYCAFSGALKPGVNDADLLQLLHPTAAVSGLPAGPAAAFIRQHEHFNRGGYAGCFGPVQRGQSEMTVAIRSGLVEGRQLDLYAGAGIVAGSEAAQEWRELERKIALPLSLFDVAAARDCSQDEHVSRVAHQS
ncbi:isochorismate synthase [Motiliproteus sediminis]|uniref:isochorismate synthase n=1 Tax=Motiliproteus sediminis TaxID=1468178 RepID=UPI001AF0189C|nr:isochorismate synthase [Motiliproteus sediminis]